MISILVVYGLGVWTGSYYTLQISSWGKRAKSALRAALASLKQ